MSDNVLQFDISYISMVRYQKGEGNMDRKLIIDGNAVYEIDENCMLRKHLEEAVLEQPEKDSKKLNEYKMKRAE